MFEKQFVNLSRLDRYLAVCRHNNQSVSAEIDSYLVNIFGLQQRYSGATVFKLYGLSNRIRRKRRNAELTKIIELFKIKEITPIILKGAAIDEDLYPTLNVRHIGDIDLLIPEADIVKACRLLAENGYRLSSTSALSDANHTTLYSDDFTVEIHKRLTKGDYPFTDDVLLRHNRTFSIGDISFRTLGITETFVYLLLHLYNHMHNDAVLQWLHNPDDCPFIENIPRYFDIALFASRYQNDINWPEVYRLLSALPFRSVMKEILIEITDLCPQTIPKTFLLEMLQKEYAAHEPTDAYVKSVQHCLQNNTDTMADAWARVSATFMPCEYIAVNKTYEFSEKKHKNPHGTCVVAGKDTDISCSWQLSFLPEAMRFKIQVTDQTPVYLTPNDMPSFDFDSVCIRLSSIDGIHRYKSWLLCPAVDEMGDYYCSIIEVDKRCTESTVSVSATVKIHPDGYDIDVFIHYDYFCVPYAGRLLFDIQVNDCVDAGQNRACCIAACSGTDDWYWPNGWYGYMK